MGGFDIYESKYAYNKPYMEPENVGYKLNSSVDDIYFTLQKRGEEGYFVSNRPGVFSLKSETCCDDIFYFKYDKIYLAVKGNVTELDGDTKRPLFGATVSLYEKGVDGREDSLIKKMTLNNRRDYLLTGLKPDKLYKVLVSKKGYLNNAATINTMGVEESDTISSNIVVNKFVKEKAYKLQNIYYDYDKADLREESLPVLDTLYVLLMENPSIIIELSSHTDSRGSDNYNRKLSQKRAESCVNYLKSLGVSTERLAPKGYGESRLINECDDGVECTDETHQANRRTEFKIIGELDAKVIYEDEKAPETKK